ncbi:Fic family protein [Maridesulfovibrio ferrireducens]|uniref:Fic family protein n=1 Tax=Maridesulfovibrio ferrireducens TaxID=246191 RepID=UPI001A23AD89|nr:Fic family protein [Maridesulfovibrio ferrireducens]MBI9112277.1 Fic family protein [Maridesulfovibrio ferrireducens]
MIKLPYGIDLETVPVLKALNKASRALAELKGEALTIPNEEILINTLTLQEAKESSAIENIVTTQDDLYRSAVDENFENVAAKEVKSYAAALRYGFSCVRDRGGLSLNMIKEIQKNMEPNKGGFRRVPGTSLKDNAGNIVYTPPQNGVEVDELMANLEIYINDDKLEDIDPLIKMALVHYQFESIHPFYDGNGRTGRIINILYLVLKGLIDTPVLYLSRYIIDNKSDYYRLLQEVRDINGYEAWIVWMLKGVEETARTTIRMVKEIRELMDEYKRDIRKNTNIYSRELLETLFMHPYTKISYLSSRMQVHRNTAASHLNTLADAGLLIKLKSGRENYYVNSKLYAVFSHGAVS